MRLDKSIAIKLRLQGKSYSQIKEALHGVSKSTLSQWLHGIIISESAKQKIAQRTREKSLAGLLKRNKNQTRLAQERRKNIFENAQAEIKSINDENLFFIGLALYWAEGYKRPIMRNGREVTYHPIGLTNSDPKLVKIFLEFLKRICKVPTEKIKADVRIFKHLNEKEVLRHWIDVTKLPQKSFTKTSIPLSKSSMNKRPFNRLPFGVIQIRISDTKLFHKIMGWIEGIKNFKI